MMVHSTPRWTCRTHVKQVLEGKKRAVAPLRNLPVIKGLATIWTRSLTKGAKPLKAIAGLKRITALSLFKGEK